MNNIVIEGNKASVVINALIDRVRILEGESYMKDCEIEKLKEEIERLKGREVPDII